MDQFWSNKIWVLLCEGPKPPNSMTSGFLNPGEPLLMDLLHQTNAKAQFCQSAQNQSKTTHFRLTLIRTNVKS